LRHPCRVWDVLVSVACWLKAHEFLALWLEGIALVAIFIWDRVDSHQAHRETLKQMNFMQRQAAATETAANAAKKSAEVSEMALRLGERADVLLNAVSLTNDPEVLSSNIAINPHCRVNMEFKNFGRTRAQNVRCLIGLISPGFQKLCLHGNRLSSDPEQRSC
jgi:hypothetical protein